MLVTETQAVTREIHVAPCLKCGSNDILLSDSGYSSFNIGGGDCKICGAEHHATVGTFPTKDQLALIWNMENDVNAMIDLENQKIAKSLEKIDFLRNISAQRGAHVGEAFNATVKNMFSKLGTA